MVSQVLISSSSAGVEVVTGEGRGLSKMIGPNGVCVFVMSVIEGMVGKKWWA